MARSTENKPPQPPRAGGAKAKRKPAAQTIVKKTTVNKASKTAGTSAKSPAKASPKKVPNTPLKARSKPTSPKATSPKSKSKATARIASKPARKTVGKVKAPSTTKATASATKSVPKAVSKPKAQPVPKASSSNPVKATQTFFDRTADARKAVGKVAAQVRSLTDKAIHRVTEARNARRKTTAKSSPRTAILAGKRPARSTTRIAEKPSAAVARKMVDARRTAKKIAAEVRKFANKTTKQVTAAGNAAKASAQAAYQKARPAKGPIASPAKAPTVSAVRKAIAGAGKPAAPAGKVAAKGKPKAGEEDITSVLHENRMFSPPQDFAAAAHISSRAEYDRLVAEARKDPDAFWGRFAEELTWFKKWNRVLDWKPPFAKWFVGGKINVSVNCLDRHLAERGDKPAIIWEGEPGDQRTLTYRELHSEVCRFANGLKSVGVKTGDRVAIYMPMVPAAAIAMLACARIGATHSIVFGGFSAEALADRINDAKAKVVVTADGGYRGDRIVRLKEAVDEAVTKCPSVKKVIVYKRTGQAVKWNAGRDVWAGDLLAKVDDDCPAVPLDSEHPLFILYTSGTTGKPKGVVHTTGGYLLWAWLTSRWVFDLKESDKYWCTADVGWVTGHTYVVYGPLANGATTFMYEGAPTIPRPDRFWDIIERHKISIFYTAPTAIRAFIKAGDQWPKKHDLSSLRLLGSVGEPINPEAWMWYHRVIGGERCPIVDTWWQTETGGIMISPLPGVTPTTPGSATLPLPGIEAEVVNAQGKPVPPNTGGLLIIKRPWPSMLRTIYGNPKRYETEYWSHIKGVYFAGDGARRDDHGYFWVLGRVDDVLNVSGHRLGTSEIESALVSHPAVAEAAVVGRPDELKGNAIAAFVILKGMTAEEANANPKLKDQLRAHVAKEIGPIAKPDDIRFTDALPKTRSGKIMRRLLRNLAAGTALGDMSTLEDAQVLEILRSQESDDE
jgi:acetyl-CoA synthetase